MFNRTLLNTHNDSGNDDDEGYIAQWPSFVCSWRPRYSHSLWNTII